MTNIVDFIDASAKFMSLDRPDVWETPDEAREALLGWMESIRQQTNSDGVGGGTVSCGSYFLIGYLSEDEEEWDLTRQICGASVFLDPDESPLVYGVTKDSGVLKYNVELTDIADIHFD